MASHLPAPPPCVAATIILSSSPKQRRVGICKGLEPRPVLCLSPIFLAPSPATKKPCCPLLYSISNPFATSFNQVVGPAKKK
ncbi:hypothetical protein M0R45_031335 [Rubus argutus]|uniref:Uncharacterized protein n=1 Tax=Rubus argutus TaxID=59490 RepID=A0AAW1WDR8_RUBAR